MTEGSFCIKEMSLLLSTCKVEARQEVEWRGAAGGRRVEEGCDSESGNHGLADILIPGPWTMGQTPLFRGGSLQVCVIRW